MQITQESFIGNVKIEKGARIRQHSNRDKGPTFEIYAVCDDHAGKSWHGEVMLEGKAIIRTESVSDNNAATTLAERALAQKFLEIFG